MRAFNHYYPDSFHLLVSFVVAISFYQHKSAVSAQTTQASKNVTQRGLELAKIPCEEPADCAGIDEAYCDVDLRICICKPDYPISDSRNCYKVSKYGEFCRLDLQCQQMDKNSRCNVDLNVCQCQNQYRPQSYSKGKEYWCVEKNTSTNFAPGSYYDPALFGIMGGLILMFIVLCVVLQLFARAQFTENRTIFNTPNPRLMNVSLMKNNRKVSNSVDQDGSQGRESRRKVISSNAGSGPALSTGEQDVEEVNECSALTGASNSIRKSSPLPETKVEIQDSKA